MNEVETDEFWGTDDSPIIKPKNVFTVNEVRSCRELFDMIKDRTLEIAPKYQRHEVWDNDKQTRFIDSLSKQLPIPSLCISNSDNFFQAIDGRQRLNTIFNFFNTEKEWILADVPDVDSEISGKSNLELLEKNTILTNKIKNIMLPVTIVMCDNTDESHLEYIFKIFHRLNSTAEVLKNQEIRNCVYSGKLNDLLNKLGETAELRKAKALNANELKRLGGSENVLMFFAFYDNLSDYQGKLTTFLNQYMIKNKNPKEEWITEHEKIFNETIAILQKITDFKKSNAVFNPLMYGIAKNIENLKTKNSKEIQRLYNTLEQQKAFDSKELMGGTWTKSKVEMRFSIAQETFCK